MNSSTLQLFEYHVWANDKLFARLEQLPEDVYDAEVQSIFSSIAQAFVHMYRFDRLWLCVLEEKPNEEIFPLMEGWIREAEGKAREDMRRLFADVADSGRLLLKRTPDWDKSMTIEHPSYGSLDTRFSELVQHIVNHGTYHRGNIAAMLRQMGHAGTPTDFVFYLLEQKNKGAAL